MYSVIAGAINHPDAINPYHGLFNQRMLKSFADSGIALDVVSPRPHAPPVGPYSRYNSIPPTADWGAYTVHHPRFWYLLPKRIFYAISGNSYANQVPKYLDRTFAPPDIVHGCHIYPDGYGLLPYVRKHNLPLFVVSHGTLLNTLQDQPVGVTSKIRETLEEATGVLCVSNALAKQASRLTDPTKVTTVPIGADPDNFPVSRKRQLRQELDIPPDATVLLFVGRFTESKGVREIIEILPHLDLDNTVFAFVGSTGDLEAELREAIGESDFSNRHMFAGLDPVAVRRWYAVADLLVLPSHSEGRPTVIYEAMASETAVLASAVGGVPEQVDDGETGVLISPGDADSLRAALISLANDRTRLGEMGTAGLERLQEKNWTWADHAARVQELHRDAIE